MVFPTGAQRVLDAVEGSRLVTLERCGHSPQIECPDQLADLVLEFPASTGRCDYFLTPRRSSIPP